MCVGGGGGEGGGGVNLITDASRRDVVHTVYSVCVCVCVCVCVVHS